jgi:prophage antirepressor-like protein
MSQLQIFNFGDAEVRTTLINGEPWWVARDVCGILGLADGRKSVELLDTDERNTVPVIDTIGRMQDTTVVNESGLYALIFKSRRKEAKYFKKWVTSEVLPAIRKTGGYTLAPVARDPVHEVDRMAGMMNQLLPALSGRILEVAGTVERQGERLAQVEERQKATDPLAIEARMRYLENCKNLLVFGTKGKPQAVTFRTYWSTLKELIGINSFQHRAALTVPAMDRCVAYAREWCETRGLVAPAMPAALDQEAIAS